MIIKKTPFWLCAFISTVALQAVMNSAFAGSAEKSDKYSWYLGAGLGVTELDPKTKNTGYKVSDDRDTGFKLFAGFDFTKSLTVEGFYTDLGSAKLTSPFASQKNGSIDYSTFGASALWYFWRNGKSKESDSRKGFQAFVHSGLSVLDTNSSVAFSQNNNVQLHYGAGLEYGLNQGFAVRAGLDLYDKDANMVFVSVLKRFGFKPRRKTVAEPVIESAAEPVAKPIAKPIVEPVVEPVAEPVVAPVVSVAIVVIDSDNDGVADDEDECADSPSDIKVDKRGCSVVALKIQSINFEPESFELTKESKIILDEAAITINASPELQKIEVQAHTDYKGSGASNMKLSDQRAQSVKAYLVSQGVNEERLVAKGYGESRPIADNKTKEGRAKNRRVELKVIKDEIVVPEATSGTTLETEDLPATEYSSTPK